MKTKTKTKTKKEAKRPKTKVKEKVDEDGLKLTKSLAKELLKLMSTKAEANVSIDEENQALVVDIKTDEEAGLIIGNRGVTLNSIQTVLGLMYQRDMGEWQRIMVNVADWREKEEDRLLRLAQQTAERAKSTGEPQPLYNLNPSQRRTVHMSLTEDKEVITESEGEGQNRYLVVSPSK